MTPVGRSWNPAGGRCVTRRPEFRAPAVSACTPRGGSPSAISARARTSQAAPTTKLPRRVGSALEGWPDGGSGRPAPRPPRADHGAASDLCRQRASTRQPRQCRGYANISGFPLTAAHQLRPTTAAPRAAAHARGLSDRPQERPRPGRRARAGLRLGPQRAVLLKFSECGLLAPFVRAGKAVLPHRVRARHRLVLRRVAPRTATA